MVVWGNLLPGPTEDKEPTATLIASLDNLIRTRHDQVAWAQARLQEAKPDSPNLSLLGDALAQALVGLQAAYDARSSVRTEEVRRRSEERAMAAETALAEAREALATETSRQADEIAAARERALDEDGVYWFRRFGTTVAIGNAAGLLGMLGATSHGELGAAILPVALDVAAWFLVGVSVSAVIPIALWLRAVCRKSWPPAEHVGLAMGVLLAAFGSFAFVWATMLALGALHTLI